MCALISFPKGLAWRQHTEVAFDASSARPQPRWVHADWIQRVLDDLVHIGVNDDSPIDAATGKRLKDGGSVASTLAHGPNRILEPDGLGRLVTAAVVVDLQPADCVALHRAAWSIGQYTWLILETVEYKAANLHVRLVPSWILEHVHHWDRRSAAWHNLRSWRCWVTIFTPNERHGHQRQNNLLEH